MLLFGVLAVQLWDELFIQNSVEERIACPDGMLIVRFGDGSNFQR
jgi:hypothetical protein